MKKIVLYLSIVGLLVAVTSCDEKLENWYSATRDYDGRFVVAFNCPENLLKSVIVEDGNEIYLYNTAENKANDIWLDDVFGVLPLKSNFKLNGTSGGFSGTGTVDNIKSKLFILNDEGKYIEFSAANRSDFPVAIAAGQVCNGIQEYARATLTEGKISPGGATSVGGNPTDGILLKLTLHTDNVKFVSVEVPEEEWENPLVREFEWKLKDGSNSPDASKDEHWTIKGYRYTGYPEDL